MDERKLGLVAVALIGILGSRWAFADAGLNACFNAAGARYNESPLVLWSIAKHESGFRPDAINRNTNGTMDIGVMQVNSVWLPTLARFGITRQHLFEPCLNIHIGAWIKAQCVQKYGYNWQSLSCYNTGHPTRGRAYAARVLKIAYRAAGG